MDICKIPKGAILLFGHGGSQSVIAITKDNKVYKYFPLITNQVDSDEVTEKKRNEYYKEILILQLLTKHFIETNKTPHLVQVYKTYYCDEVPKSFFKNCLKYSEYLLSKNEAEPICNYIYQYYPNFVNKGMHIANLEYCDNNLGNHIYEISTKSIDEIKIFLDRLFFQVIFTLEIIRKKYPLFMHGDLFIRNILTIKNDNYKDDEYVKYIVNTKEYYLPANGLFIKLNDFGETQLSKEIEEKYTPERRVIDQETGMYRDWFNILYDVYNGQNLGGFSLLSLFPRGQKIILKNRDKIKFIKKYFNRFMDVAKIDKIIDNNKKVYLDYDWQNTYDASVVKLLKLQKPNDILKYFQSVYKGKDIDEDKVVKIYGN